jgi:hypothetical protein
MVSHCISDWSLVLPKTKQKCELKRHQIDGVAWLKSREKGKKRGGILADDMGLGKVCHLSLRHLDYPKCPHILC